MRAVVDVRPTAVVVQKHFLDRAVFSLLVRNYVVSFLLVDALGVFLARNDGLFGGKLGG